MRMLLTEDEKVLSCKGISVSFKTDANSVQSFQGVFYEKTVYQFPVAGQHLHHSVSRTFIQRMRRYVIAKYLFKRYSSRRKHQLQHNHQLS